jgi:hypothetical protein
MINSLRSKLSAAAVIVGFTVAACCSPSEQGGACDSPSGMNMDPMGMSTMVCPLVILTQNDPKPPPLFPYIGTAHWHVPWGQDYFDQGLRFFYAFNNRESYRAFSESAREAEDSKIPCSACYWAQALVLGVDLNMPTQSDEDQREAKADLYRARNANPSPEDSAIIDALSGRYQDCNGKARNECQDARNRAYYDGMKRVLDMFGRDDPNVITLFADSAMNLTAWNYWKADGSPVRPEVTEARQYLERALNFAQYPPNEGPIHWYIHLMEQSSTPDVALRYANQLGPIAPNAGHLVHMSSHIYLRLGDMPNTIKANKAAIEADERYFAAEPDLYRPDGDRYRYEYYPHNINFFVAGAVLSGDNAERDVNRYAEKLLQSLPHNGNGPDTDAYRTTYYLSLLNFTRPAGIRNFAPPSPFAQQPLANIAFDFAQLMADLWDGGNSKQAIDKLDVDVAHYRNDAAGGGDPKANCDTPPGSGKRELCLTAILSDLAHARTAASNKNWEEAITAAEHARAIQDHMPYTEPPVWPYPVRQTLASILIRKADADGPSTQRGRQDLQTAKQQLFESLNLSPDGRPKPQISTETYPGNGWAYYGLWEIAKRDNASQADIDSAWKNLNDHWFGSAEFHTLDRL